MLDNTEENQIKVLKQSDMVVDDVADIEETKMADMVTNMKVDEVQTNGYICTFSH